MLKYFDKTFFKFLVGFVAILAVSFIIIIITGYYKSDLNKDMMEQEQTQMLKEFVADDSCLTGENC
jgi:preprotein translocase subunit SecG